MKVVICGAGQMGIAAVWAMRELGHEISVIDTSEEALDKIKKHFPFKPEQSASRERFEVKTYSGVAAHFTDVIKESDIVISTLPYFANYNLAIICINNNVSYCDLGGNVRTSESVNLYAKEHGTSPVFTDLGLAPGWINIIAEAGYQTVKDHGITDLKMYVGGLPVITNLNSSSINPLKYMPTWSIDGLINEYLDDCIILEDGEIKTVEGMSGLYTQDDIEAFYTSGGSAHTIKIMHERGLDNCEYKTLRYPGHQKLVKWLYKTFGKKGLVKAFETAPKYYEDRVQLSVSINCEDGTDWSYDDFIYQHISGNNDSTKLFSAMQKCTAFPLTVVAHLMAKDQIPDMNQKIVLSYEDVPYESFNDILDKLFECYTNENLPSWLKGENDE